MKAISTEAASSVVAAPPAPPTPSTFAAFRHRNYRLFAGAMLVSMAGAWMQIIAQGWLVYQLSHSEFTLGLVGFAAAIPALLVSPVAGVIVDRVPKRSILLATQSTAMLLALLLATLTFTGVVQVWHVLLLAVGIGAVNAIDNPARQAFVVEMVGRDDLANAIALNSMIFNGARIVGPALGGLLLAAVGAAWCFLLNGFSFLATIGALAAMQLPRHTRRLRFVSPWQELSDGVRYLAQHVEMRTLILQSLIFSVFGISYSTVLPAYAEEVLQAGAAAYGAIQAVAGIGAVSAALLILRFSHRVPRGRWLLLSSLLFPLVLLAFAWTQRVPVALLFSYFLGMGFLSQFTMLNTLLQTRVEDDMRGRVMSLYTLTFNGFSPFGNLGLGAIAEQWGLSRAFTLFAGITLVLSSANLLGRNGVRNLK